MVPNRGWGPRVPEIIVVLTLFDRGEDVTDSQGLLGPPLTAARPRRGELKLGRRRDDDFADQFRAWLTAA